MKQVVRQLRALSPDDRFAMIAFAGRSYILTPLTTDDGALALRLFKSNRTAGLIWFVSLLLVHVSGGFHV